MTSSKKRKQAPAMTIEGREDQLIAMAVDLAEQQLKEGTASSQVITHFLKLGTTREKIEKEILEEKKDLLKAQTENLQSNKKIEQLYSEALDAMRTYSGQDRKEEEADD